jgi:hypothetical protein
MFKCKTCFIGLSNANELFSQCQTTMLPRNLDFMSSDEGRGRVTQESLFLFTLQAFEGMMMGPSKLVIAHQCRTHTIIISTPSSSSFNSSADLLIYVVNSQVFAKTIAITHFLGRDLETLIFWGIQAPTKLFKLQSSSTKEHPTFILHPLQYPSRTRVSLNCVKKLLGSSILHQQKQDSQGTVIFVPLTTRRNGSNVSSKA